MRRKYKDKGGGSGRDFIALALALGHVTSLLTIK